ncbi:MAG: adenylate/guanylate cyclase domain-containing protein [Xanthobacteraceae bacterium]|nr:adenylate/guanylate cyclase domain-containing protein [Xanthobacteraceae bacterium]
MNESLPSPVLAWLQSDGVKLRDTAQFVERFAAELLAAGVDIYRLTTGVHIVHPQIDASSSLWQKGKPVTERRWKMDRQMLQNSPMAIVYSGKRYCARLDGPPEAGEFPILSELRAEGVTEYIGLPLPFSDGSWKAVSYATQRAGGFPEHQVALLESLVPTLAMILEIQTLQRTTLTLLDTYVGPVAGRRVLDGAIKRGMCDEIEAVIWFCDLRGFTELSENLSGAELVSFLNDYFGAMTDAVGRHGGEVLKFIGDALLAIFPLSGETGSLVAERALAAATDAEAAIRALNEKRRESGQPAIRFGLALHVGEVLYGNIGGANRLDFTVIGQAVNVASRIENLTKTLGRQILFSGDFAELCRGKGEPLGTFPLKGGGAERPVYALTVDGAP